MIRIILLIILILLKFTFSYSQNSIEGRIKDTEKLSLPFANIVLYENEKPVTGVVSNDEGFYIFDNIADGTYLIEVSMLGLKTIKSESFQLSEDNNSKKLDFTLEEESQTLNEVVVKSKRPVIKQTAEKLVINLENSEMVSNNLQDVMKRIPGVIVTNNGISYAGQSGIRILINGKTTEYMDIETLLRDFPADNIAKIELIEQPGSEFDAEGSGPIINIILKKNIKLGTHGNVKAWVGEDQGIEYGTSASIASYKNKLNWQASAGYSAPTWREDLLITREVANTTYDQVTISPYAPKNFRVSAGIDYYINDKHTIGLGLRRQNSMSDRISSDKTSIITNNITDVLNTENHYDRDRVVYNVNPYYEFDTKKNKFTVDFNYVNYNNENVNNLLKVGQNTIDYDNQRYFQDGSYEIKTYKGDYKHTFSDDISLSLGTKYAQVNTDNDLRSFTQDINGTFNFIANESNRFLVDESIIAFYSKLNLTVDKWSFSGGLRFEDSKTTGTSTSDNKTKERKISKLFPSASISREITKSIGVGLSYSYRIRRPSYNSLNSFVYYYNPIASEKGNPNLKPAFTNSYQFNLTYDGQPFFTVGYRSTKDALLQLITQDDTTGEISRSMDNLDEKKNWNFRLFAPLSFIKGVEGYTGFIVDYNQLLKSDGLATALNLSKWSLTWYTSAEYELPWKINSEISGFYSTGHLEGQVEMEWLAGMDFAISKKFLDGKLKANLGMRNILNRQYNGKIRYANINADILSRESKQNIYLQLTYSFGSKFGKKKENLNSSQDEEDRINDNN